MGPVLSTNTANETINALVNVSVNATQNCQTQFAQNQNLVIKGNNGTTINLGDIDWSQVVSVDISCLQSSKTDADISQALQQAASQVASAINQAFSANPGSTQANNTVNAVANVAVNISESFKQKCKAIIVQSQNFTIEDNTNSRIMAGNINWNQVINDVVDCVNKDISKNTATQQVKQSISQSAKSEVESILGPLIFIILIILVIGGGFFLKGEQVLTDPKTWILVLGLVAAYFGIAWAFSWWPFEKSSQT